MEGINNRPLPNQFFSSSNIQSSNNEQLQGTKSFPFTSSKKSDFSHLPKPDLSPLTQKDMKFSLKCHGSYKKPKTILPESPMKSPIQNYFTPIKIEGKNLFGTLPKKDNTFRKLNFDESETHFPEQKRKMVDLLDNVDEKEEEIFNSPKPSDEGSIKIDCEENTLNQNNFQMNYYDPFRNENNTNKSDGKYKMERDFKIIKTLSENKFDAVYKCKHIKTGKIYAIKKSYKTSSKNNYDILQKIFVDISRNINLLSSRFCVRYLDYWKEEETYNLVENSTHFTDKNLYILTEYYPNGDLLDYLSQLEQSNYVFTSGFYWDIIFEMLLGLNFFHECGYLHLDIKPANMLIDNQGYIKLSDFGLSQKISELAELDDIFEGDSTYISPEVFDRTNVKDLDTKCDIYSLGLSILEIMAKVELPKNGPLWRAMRTYELKDIPEEFLVNWNIQDQKPFMDLINRMIAPYKERITIPEILQSEHFPEIKKRYYMFMNNCYTKCTSTLLNDIQMECDDYGNDKMIIESPR